MKAMPMRILKKLSNNFIQLFLTAIGVVPSKSKVASGKHSLRTSDMWVKQKDRTKIRNIAVDTENSKSSNKNEAECLNNALLIFMFLIRWLIYLTRGDYHFSSNENLKYYCDLALPPFFSPFTLRISHGANDQPVS